METSEEHRRHDRHDGCRGKNPFGVQRIRFAAGHEVERVRERKGRVLRSVIDRGRIVVSPCRDEGIDRKVDQNRLAHGRTDRKTSFERSRSVKERTLFEFLRHAHEKLTGKKYVHRARKEERGQKERQKRIRKLQAVVKDKERHLRDDGGNERGQHHQRKHKLFSDPLQPRKRVTRHERSNGNAHESDRAYEDTVEKRKPVPSVAECERIVFKVESVRKIVHFRLENPFVGHEPAIDHKYIGKQKHDGEQNEKSIKQYLSRPFRGTDGTPLPFPQNFYIVSCHIPPTYSS